MSDASDTKKAMATREMIINHFLSIPPVTRPDFTIRHFKPLNEWRIEARSSGAKKFLLTWNTPAAREHFSFDQSDRVFLKFDRLPLALRQIQAAGLTVYREES